MIGGDVFGSPRAASSVRCSWYRSSFGMTYSSMNPVTVASVSAALDEYSKSIWPSPSTRRGDAAGTVRGPPASRETEHINCPCERDSVPTYALVKLEGDD